MKSKTSKLTNLTRPLGLSHDEKHVLTRPTGPLEQGLPWVIELRIVGTASTVQTQVQDEMLLGRADVEREIIPEIDLTPFGAAALGVSRKHAVILVKQERLGVKDLGSMNGTRLNGALCEADQEFRLHHGDELWLGKLRLQVLYTVVPVVDAKLQTGETPPTPLQVAKSGKGRHVLVIEDDPDVGEVFLLALENAGYTVAVVETVSKALSVVFQKLPDLIILDLLLPDMNGLDLIRYIRKQHPDRHVPMLVVSGASGGFQMNRALEAGADGFLSKPVAVDELVNAVNSAVGV